MTYILSFQRWGSFLDTFPRLLVPSSSVWRPCRSRTRCDALRAHATWLAECKVWIEAKAKWNDCRATESMSAATATKQLCYSRRLPVFTETSGEGSVWWVVGKAREMKDRCQRWWRCLLTMRIGTQRKPYRLSPSTLADTVASFLQLLQHSWSIPYLRVEFPPSYASSP